MCPSERSNCPIWKETDKGDNHTIGIYKSKQSETNKHTKNGHIAQLQFFNNGRQHYI